MKVTSTLLAILAIIGLGQTHQVQNFGSGPLYDDLSDFAKLVPAEKVSAILTEYITEDAEVQEAITYLLTSTILPDLVRDVEAIPEVMNLVNYLHKEGLDVYLVLNEINKALGLKELEPPPRQLYSPIAQRTGGIAGLFKDIGNVLPLDEFIHTYAQKLKTSTAFGGLIGQLKSDNFQQAVNKVYNVKSVQIILNGLKSSGVNTQIAADLLFIVLGITVPNDVSVYVLQERTLDEEFEDFVKLLSVDEIIEIVIKYATNDEKVINALRFMLTTEFHSMLREIEALNPHQALVVYLEKAGLHVIQGIQLLHEAIGMEDYVPPKIDSLFESQIGVQKVGDGMKGMIEEIYNTLPLDKIDALYKEKLQNSKVFADFVGKIKSPDMQKLINDLYGNATYKNFVMKSREKGLEFQELTKLTARIFGLEFPY
ncbi:PREDICTED: uncharacterized protein LOC105564547 [Vollenhovia emeryi]|uniref:uncharacterized protein LOC105564547 n=1 Tax=Vollenhovia emeryi TaxID=411798 RepID=UPI0005F4CE3F|nr:PREDICTED: uncharacterized protein LOC105564547 [Vollenhovia emeryi]